MSDLAILTSPDPSLPLLLYIAASPYAVSAALVQEQDREGTTRQCPVYYVSEVLTASKCNMTELEKISYIVVMASRKLCHYFKAFKVRVTSDIGLGELFRNPKASTRVIWVDAMVGLLPGLVSASERFADVTDHRPGTPRGHRTPVVIGPG